MPASAGPAAPPPLPYGSPMTRMGAGRDEASLRWLLPVGRSGWAIAAGYAGLLAFVVLPAPVALVLGVVAITDLRRHRHLRGMGRAVFGVVMGVLGCIALAAFLIATAGRA